MSKVNRNVCASPWQEMIIDLTGEVVPCCFWTGYGNTGKPLGNTNENTLDEIWDGGAYRDLRKRMASGDLEGHPCDNCMAARWANGQFPKFRWPAGFTKEQGFCYFGVIPDDFQKEIVGSDEATTLLEDGEPLALPDEAHDAIRQQGGGRYSVWKGWLYFSTSDNSDPAHNGRRYELRCGETVKLLGSLEKDSLSGTNLLNAYDEYQAGIVEMSAKPSMISLISTADCNIDCPGCSQNTVRLANVQHRQETVPDVLAHVPYVHQFIWHGGEPYLINRFRQFIDEFQTKDNPNLTFGFTSNGTMITPKEAEKLKKFPRINASVSVDSFNKESFEKIRAGANYEGVMRNLFRLLEDYSVPKRVYSVGMIICKSNMLELADNLRFAIEHDIALNLSPVVVYPVTEQLDVFEDFARQTEGWEEVINEAASVVELAKAQNKLAVQRIDPTDMVSEIGRIYEQAKARYADLVRIKVKLNDPSRTIPSLRCPGIVVKMQDHLCPLSYLSLRAEQAEYELLIPGRELHGNFTLNWYLLHDLNEPMGNLTQEFFREKKGHAERMGKLILDFFRDKKGHTGRSVHVSGFKKMPDELVVNVPDFDPPAYKPNILFANYGEPTPEGLHVKAPKDIEDAYQKMAGRTLVPTYRRR